LRRNCPRTVLDNAAQDGVALGKWGLAGSGWCLLVSLLDLPSMPLVRGRQGVDGREIQLCPSWPGSITLDSRIGGGGVEGRFC
jgi:hypothetical protein